MKKILWISGLIICLMVGGCATPFYVAKVAPGIYRSARPNAAEMRLLAHKGIKSVLDLESSSEARKERKLAQAAGLQFVSLSMSNLTRPTLAQLRQAYRDLEVMPQPVDVHCLRGHDRTGWTIAIWRMWHDGWTEQRAYDEALRYGHSAWFYDHFPFYWKRSLKAAAVSEGYRI